MFLNFLFEFHDDRLRSLLEGSAHAFAFLRILNESAAFNESELVDIFLIRDMGAEDLTRSELVMLLDWRQAFIMEGIFQNKVIEFESREDEDGECQRQ